MGNQGPINWGHFVSNVVPTLFTDPLSRIAFWVRVYLFDEREGTRNFVSLKIDETIEAISSPDGKLSGWMIIIKRELFSDTLFAKAKKAVLELARNNPVLSLHAYVDLPEGSPLKKSLAGIIDQHSRGNRFSFDDFEWFYKALRSGDKMESFALWGMARLARQDVASSLRVYKLVYRLRGMEDIEEKLRKTILKLAQHTEAKIYAYINAPIDSKLREDLVLIITEDLNGLRDNAVSYLREVFSICLKVPSASSLRGVLLGILDQEASGLLKTNHDTLKFWIFVYDRSSHARDMCDLAFGHIRAICDLAESKAVAILRKIADSRQNTDLGEYLDRRISDIESKQGKG